MDCRQSDRGSVLVTALIFSAVIAVALTGYVVTSTTAYRLSQRSFYANGAIDLTDTGLEQVLWSENNGNGVLSGVVYAPNGNLTLAGGGTNGNILGSMVGNTISVTGNSSFHYDESLANLGSSNLWQMQKWRELTSASDRSLYASQLSF